MNPVGYFCVLCAWIKERHFVLRHIVEGPEEGTKCCVFMNAHKQCVWFYMSGQNWNTTKYTPKVAREFVDDLFKPDYKGRARNVSEMKAKLAKIGYHVK